MTKGYAEPVETRLWKSYDPEPNSGCWLWALTYNRDGYGLVNTLRKTRQAHRVAYELAVGPIPAGMQIRHRCDVPACINPAHLSLGTNADNMDDRNSKGRQRHDARLLRAPLNRAVVAEIRHRYRTGTASHQELADDYGVSRPTITYLVNGKTWKGVA